MKQIALSERASAEALFQNSIYKNSHLGWLQLWDIPETGGQIWLDTAGNRNFLIALQPSEAGILWLHTFFADQIPGEYPLTRKIKEILPPGSHSLYTISSHSWFNRLLERNGFRKCDEIIEMETTDIHLPDHSLSADALFFIEDITAEDYYSCECAFPPLWRLSPLEAETAVSCSSYKLLLREKGKIIGCLLADFADSNCHIQRIAVLPEHQNKGAASAMIKRMTEDALNSGVKSFSVNTNLNNSIAVRFYNKMNFRIEGKQYPVYYHYL